jgi:hypothetical protein
MDYRDKVLGLGWLALAMSMALPPSALAQGNDGYSRSSRVFDRQGDGNSRSGSGGSNAGGASDRQASLTPAKPVAPATNNGAAAPPRATGNRGGQNPPGQAGQAGQTGQNRRGRAQQAGMPGGGGQAQPAGGPTQIGGAPGGGGKGGSGSAAGFTMVGKIPEVSKGFAESLRTRRVDFDSKKAGLRPNVILFGPRKLDPKELAGREDRALAKPL